jgi:hypothetical protein
MALSAILMSVFESEPFSGNTATPIEALIFILLWLIVKG